jgi:hypothetical protein
MARFIAVHTMPMTEEQLFEAFKTIPTPPKGISWKQSYIDFKDNKFFCEWEAASKEPIEEYFKAVKMPYDAVYPVKLFNVAKKKFVD